MTRQTLIYAFCSLWILGCGHSCQKQHRDMTAEEVVEAYLNTALNMEDLSEKFQLMEWTTGSLQAAISGATDATIREAYLDQRYEIERFSVLHKQNLTPRETKISYLLEYRELPKGETDFSKAPVISTENRVLVVRERERWVIDRVLGNRTEIDFPVSANITPEATP